MRRVTLLVLGCCLSTVAAAADNGVYLGAGIAQSDYGLSNPLDVDPFDDKDNGFKLIAGWRPLDNFGIEANYIDHGNATVPAGIARLAACSVRKPLSVRSITVSVSRAPM